MGTHHIVLACILLVSTLNGLAQTDSLSSEAEHQLHRAAAFFREQVAVQGGYLWRYSADLTRREGEGKATDTMAWVQPPGTPAVGMAFLNAYEQTGDGYYLEAAVETAGALLAGQLQSGGWDYRIEFKPEKRRGYAYRKDGRTDGHNVTTLDDDTTQAALRCLILVDRALDFKNTALHEAAQYGLDCLLKAQYPNGAWPQRYNTFPDPARHPVKQAAYPESWSREYEKHDYSEFYTLNDNTLADMIGLMFLAAEIYGNDRYRAAAIKGGDFILLAQMPDPQPAWAQQYDFDMHPAWARKFEPPAITGGESQGILRLLLDLHTRTGDRRYLESADRALAYLKTSLRPDGKLARFYELQTNTPLYFTRDYELTFSDADTPTHYSFVTQSGLDGIEKDYRAACETAPASSSEQTNNMPGPPVSVEKIKEVIDALDARGAWVERGKLRYHGEDDPTEEVIDTQTFIRNAGMLAAYIAAEKH